MIDNKCIQNIINTYPGRELDPTKLRIGNDYDITKSWQIVGSSSNNYNNNNNNNNNNINNTKNK